jgi:hypothetical protein
MLREQTNRSHRAERTMNYISAEANLVVETESNDIQLLDVRQTEDAITELSSAQLRMVGGGGCVVLQ